MTNIKHAGRLRYSIGEVAKMLHVKTSLIRFWQESFPSIKVKKTITGRRYFEPKDVELLHLIYHLVKEKGYTLKGAKEYIEMEKRPQTLADDVEIVKTLKEIKLFLIRLREAL